MRGKQAEDRAAAYLQGQGLAIVARNWRCRGGELDLICRQGSTLVFVEVRSRIRTDFGGAAASITTSKRQRLIHAAQTYLASLGRLPACRFDAVLIEGEQLTWLQDAFQAEA
jgi:putative endonuclease